MPNFPPTTGRGPTVTGRRVPETPLPAPDGSPADAFDLLHEVLSRLIEDPDSSEPFSLLLEQIITETGARGGAVLVTTDTGRQQVLLACSEGEDQGFWNTYPRLPPAPGLQEDPVRLTADPLDAAGALVCLRLAQGERGHGLLALRLGTPPEEVPALALAGLARHAARLARILYSTRQARLKLRHAQSEERAAIARELHDSLAQSLSYMKIQVSLLQGVVGGQTPPLPSWAAEVDTLARELRETANLAYRHLRELITTFRLTMHGRSFAQALEDSVEEFEHRSTIAFELDNRVPAGLLTVAEEMQLLHIVREALANVVRHSRASRCRVCIRQADDGSLRLDVEDDGAGLSDRRAPARRHGLTIMEERAQALGGTFRVCSGVGGGTRVEVRCPGKAGQRPGQAGDGAGP